MKEYKCPKCQSRLDHCRHEEVLQQSIFEKIIMWFNKTFLNTTYVFFTVRHTLKCDRCQKSHTTYTCSQSTVDIQKAVNEMHERVILGDKNFNI